MNEKKIQVKKKYYYKFTNSQFQTTCIFHRQIKYYCAITPNYRFFRKQPKKYARR